MVHMHTERSTNAYNKTPPMPGGVVGEKKPRTTRSEGNKSVFNYIAVGLGLADSGVEWGEKLFGR